MEYDKFLVRAVGTNTIEKVREVLDQHNILYKMSGSRRDDVEFYVRENRLRLAKELLKNSDKFKA